MQKAYDIFFRAGCLAVLIFAALPSVAAVLPISPTYVGIAVVGVIAIFFPPSLLFRYSDDRRSLRPPRRVRAEALGLATAVGLLLWIAVFAYGLYAWPAWPLRQEGAAYVDKGGRTYTRREYRSYQVWEVTFWSVFGMTAIGGLLSSPLLDARGKRRRFGGVRGRPGI